MEVCSIESPAPLCLQVLLLRLSQAVSSLPRESQCFEQPCREYTEDSTGWKTFWMEGSRKEEIKIIFFSWMFFYLFAKYSSNCPAFQAQKPKLPFLEGNTDSDGPLCIPSFLENKPESSSLKRWSTIAISFQFISNCYLRLSQKRNLFLFIFRVTNQIFHWNHEKNIYLCDSTVYVTEKNLTKAQCGMSPVWALHNGT